MEEREQRKEPPIPAPRNKHSNPTTLEKTTKQSETSLNEYSTCRFRFDINVFEFAFYYQI